MTDIEPKTIEAVKRAYLGGATNKQLASKFKLSEPDIENITRNLPKPKYYYDVKVEALLPATLTYRVLAESPEMAAEQVKGMSPNSVNHKLVGRKEMKLTVYDSGSSMIKFIKNLLGR